MDYTKEWNELLSLNTRSKKVVCPFCKDVRSNPTSSPSLSVDWRNGRAMCHYCNKVIFREKKSGGFNRLPINKHYTIPEAKGCDEYSVKMIKYFMDRGISVETLKKARITEGKEVFAHLSPDPRNCIIFNYYLEKELVNIKYRDGAKNFKLVANARIIPYNIDSILDYPEEDIYITEGEIDTLTLIELGVKVAISVPNGSNSNLTWLDDFYHLFKDKQIVLCTDNDIAGQKLTNELKRRFEIENIYEMDYFGYKDINDLLVGLGKEAALESINKKKRPKVEGIFQVSDIISDIYSLYDKGLQKGYTLGLGKLDDILSFETKRLCTITGIPGSGKSEFVDVMNVNLNQRYGLKTAYFSPENFPIPLHFAKIYEKISGGRFSKITGDIDDKVVNHINDNFFFINPQEYTLKNILSAFRFLVRSHGVKICVIDPYNRVDWDSEGEYKNLSETQMVSRILDAIQNFAVQYDVLFVIVAHPTKMRRLDNGQITVPSLYDINGSANFFNKTDFGITIHRDRIENKVQIHIQKVKFKHLGEPGMVEFIYNYHNGRIHPWHDRFNVHVDFDNSNYLKADTEKPTEYQDFYEDNIYGLPY